MQENRTVFRRLLQFRLRTLLVLVAVFALFLTWIGYATKQQIRAVAVVRDLGGTVYYEGDKPFSDLPAPRSWLRWWTRSWLQDDYFVHVIAVYLTEAHCSDAELETLGRLSKLQVLDLSSTRVTPLGLQHLKKLIGLRSLYLDRTTLSDADMAELREALPNCSISSTQVLNTANVDGN
jgi:hypothetical protein